MSTSMVSTVLEIEREAEAVIAASIESADTLAKDAKAKREEASREILAQAKKDVAGLERAAAAEREVKVKELVAAGDEALAAVKNISDAAFDSGVRHVLKTLAGK